MDNRLKNRNAAVDFFAMLPAFLFILSIMVMRMYRFKMPLTDVYWTNALDTTSLSNITRYWKSVVIVVSAGFAIAIAIIYYCQEWLYVKKGFLYIPALIYMICVLLSLAFSEHKYFAIHGNHYSFEGTFVLLAYVIMVLFLFNMVDSERRVRMVVFCALGAAVLLGILGLTQTTGHNLLATTVVQKMIAPNYTLKDGSTYWELIDNYAAQGKVALGFKGNLVQTVGNRNYVSFYLSLLLPVIALVFIYFSSDRKKMPHAVISLLAYGLLLYNFFAVKSASGYFGLAAMFIAALIVFFKYLKKWIKPILCLVLVTVLVMGILADSWLPEVRTVFSFAVERLTATAYADSSSEAKLEFENEPGTEWRHLSYIETEGRKLIVAFKGGTKLYIVRNTEEHKYELYDTQGDPLEIEKIKGANGKYKILDKRYHDYITVTFYEVENEDGMIELSMMRYNWKFHYNGETFLFRNKFGKEVVLHPIEHSNLFKASFGNGRGRIYNTTIPLLKNYILFGAGADNFIFAYPQNDYVTTYNRHADMNVIVDKPHDFYLHYWVNTGLLSVLAWLALVGCYLVGAIRYLRKCRFEEFSDFANGGIFCGILAFLAVALLNDSGVTVMPMFYAMLGTGLAINAKHKWESQKKPVKNAK